MKHRRKRIWVFMLSLLMISTCTLNVFAEDGVNASKSDTGIYTIVGNTENIPDLMSESAIVVDMKTGYTIYEKNIYDKHYPASITKIMTALLTLEQASMEEVVTFSHAAVFSVEAGSSVAYIDEGEKLTVEQCLYGLMLVSGNDVANGLAEHVGGTMGNFASMMTNRAAELGCVSTSFANAHGLHDDNHYTCAYDMAIIAKKAYDSHETFRTICSTLIYECAPTNKQSEVRIWRNGNRLINQYEDIYYEDCIGGKTGYTSQAGGTLVTFAEINGRTLLCVTMKSSNSSTAFADTTNLYDFIRDNVTKNMYKALDERYEREHQPEEEPTSNSTGSHDESVSTNVSNQSSDKINDSEEDEGLWIGWKILILLVTVFVIYYVYVRYMRYLRRKRRRERRMMERRNQQNRQR